MAGFIGLKREAAELGVTTEASPRMLAGVEPGPGPRHASSSVDDVDATLTELKGDGALPSREPADLPWGERVAYRPPTAMRQDHLPIAHR